MPRLSGVCRTGRFGRFGLLAACCHVALTGGVARAQPLPTLPEPGLWEQQVQMLLNGQDIMGAVHAAQGEILRRLSPEQRRQVEGMLPPQGSAPGTFRQCLTAAQVAEMSDPRKALGNALRGQQRCSAQIVSVTGATVAFKGRCDDPQSFTGDYSGTYTVVDRRRWTYTLQGRGTVSPQATAGTPAEALLGGPIEMQGRGEGRWLATECGNVPSGG